MSVAANVTKGRLLCPFGSRITPLDRQRYLSALHWDPLGSHGAQSLIDSSAAAHRAWRQKTDVATAHFRGIRQTQEDYHLSEHLYAFAHLRSPDAPVHTKLWVEERLAASLTDCVRAVLDALKWMRPHQPTVREAP